MIGGKNWYFSVKLLVIISVWDMDFYFCGRFVCLVHSMDIVSNCLGNGIIEKEKKKKKTGEYCAHIWVKHQLYRFQNESKPNIIFKIEIDTVHTLTKLKHQQQGLAVLYSLCDRKCEMWDLCHCKCIVFTVSGVLISFLYLICCFFFVCPFHLLLGFNFIFVYVALAFSWHCICPLLSINTRKYMCRTWILVCGDVWFNPHCILLFRISKQLHWISIAMWSDILSNIQTRPCVCFGINMNDGVQFAPFTKYHGYTMQNTYK